MICMSYLDFCVKNLISKSDNSLSSKPKRISTSDDYGIKEITQTIVDGLNKRKYGSKQYETLFKKIYLDNFFPNGCQKIHFTLIEDYKENSTQRLTIMLKPINQPLLEIKLDYKFNSLFIIKHSSPITNTGIGVDLTDANSSIESIAKKIIGFLMTEPFTKTD